MERDWATIHRQLESWQASGEQPSSDGGEVLRTRAAELARLAQAASDAEQSLELLTFTLGETWFGLPVRNALEILPLADCTPVPGAPPQFVGLFNLRGAIGALFDLRSFLGHSVPPHDEGTHAIVMGRDKPEFALRVDVVGEILTLGKDALLPLPELLREGREFLRGVSKEGLVVIHGETLLDDPRLFIGRESDRQGGPETELAGE